MAARKDGKQGHKSDKEWRDAIRLAVHEMRAIEDKEGRRHKFKTLRLLAVAVVEKALDGDVTALKEIGDRLDGKAAQTLDVNQRITLIELLRDWSRTEDAPALEDQSDSLRDRGTEGNA